MDTPPIDGPWYITERAAREYGALMGYAPDSDLEREKAELAQISVRARPVRRQENGLELWRAWVGPRRRIRLLVGEPGVAHPGSKPALVQVLAEHTRGPKAPRESQR
jgi:hypothetical protein